MMITNFPKWLPTTGTCRHRAIVSVINILLNMKMRSIVRPGGIYAKQYAVSFLLSCQGRIWRRVLSGGSLGRPYLMTAHGADDYCVHLDWESCRCTVWEQRPVPCGSLTVRIMKMAGVGGL